MRESAHTARPFASGLLAVTFLGGLLAASAWASERREEGKTQESRDPLVVDDGGMIFRIPRSGATVGDALRAAGLSWSDDDLLVPADNTPLSAADHAFLLRTRTVTLRVGTDLPRTFSTRDITVGDILAVAGVTLSPLDRTTPQRNMPLPDGGTVTVTRISEDTRTEEERIPPAVIHLSDTSLPLGTDVVEDPGSPGRAEVLSRIRTENGKEISRTVLKRTVTEEPRTRRVRRGAKTVSRGAETGWASWFVSAPKTAAHRSFPFGTRLRIIRTDTRTATTVTVRDRGPFLLSRVIDLSTDAFRTLAPLAAGTIHVRVERSP